MQEIKFRAWHEYGTSVKPPVPGYVYDERPGDCVQWKAANQAITAVEQFTGLQDSQGVDIYEGDICSYSKIKFAVVFKNAAFGYMFFGDFHWLVNFNRDDLKIIGNIHEHKHLLEEHT